MKKVKCGNPLATSLRKGQPKQRSISASDFKKVVVKGLKYCAWCGVNRVRGNRKYCQEACRDHVYAFCYPQKEWGLEYHLQLQSFKCKACDFNYKPMLDEINERIAGRNIKCLDETGCASPYTIGSLKIKIEDEYGKSKRLEVDHIVPIALGGDPVGMDNHQVLCHDCHKSKTKLDVSQIAEFRRNKDR